MHLTIAWFCMSEFSHFVHSLLSLSPWEVRSSLLSFQIVLSSSFILPTIPRASPIIPPYCEQPEPLSASVTSQIYPVEQKSVFFQCRRLHVRPSQVGPLQSTNCKGVLQPLLFFTFSLLRYHMEQSLVASVDCLSSQIKVQQRRISCQQDQIPRQNSFGVV